MASGDESSAEHSFSTRAGIQSGPVAFDGSRAARLRCTVDLQFIQGEVRITQAAFASKILSQVVCFALGSVILPSVFS